MHKNYFHIFTKTSKECTRGVNMRVHALVEVYEIDVGFHVNGGNQTKQKEMATALPPPPPTVPRENNPHHRIYDTYFRHLFRYMRIILIFYVRETKCKINMANFHAYKLRRKR